VAALLKASPKGAQHPIQEALSLTGGLCYRIIWKDLKETLYFQAVGNADLFHFQTKSMAVLQTQSTQDTVSNTLSSTLHVASTQSFGKPACFEATAVNTQITNELELCCL
jgi:hypothetical protein